MLFIFGKEHNHHMDRKDRKLMKLVKKLEQEDDENWHAEQQRRLEQEEKDAAFARELQEQIASDESSTRTDDAYVATSAHSSPMTSSFVATPSPLSSSPPPIPAKPSAYYSHSGSPSSSLPYNDAYSSSSASQRAIPPSPYQNGQPPLPPRQRTVSLLSQYNSSSPEPSAYHASPNPAAASEIGHPSYYSGMAQQLQHREPAMLIVPQPPKEYQYGTTTTTYGNSFYSSSIIPMPESELGRSTPFHPYTNTPPYDPSIHSTSTAPISHPMYIPTPPASLSSSFHSLPITSNTFNGTAMTAASTTPEPPHTQEPITMKPDAKPEKQRERPSRTLFTTSTSTNSANIPQPTTVKVEPKEDSDDDDDDSGSMFWACNDGRMMASTPSNSKSTTITHNNSDKPHSISRQVTRNGKHMVSAAKDVDDSGSGSDEDGDDGGDDTAIDPFDIRDGDNVIIYQHNNSSASTHSMGNNNDTPGDPDDEDDPFADRFAVEPTTTIDHHHESIQHLHTNTHLPTTAKVHDPLLAMASTKQPASTLPWACSQFASSSVSVPATATTPSLGPSTQRPASVHQYPLHGSTDNEAIQHVVPTNVLRVGAPPNIQLMRNQVTAEVPSNEFGYYQHQTSKPGSEKEEVDDTLMENVPKLPKTHPDHRHITVPSVVENERVWIRVHPTDTGKSLATRIHIVATYKTRKILSIKTDKGRSILLDDTPVFQDWESVMQMEDGAPWKVEWMVIDNNPWECPKEFLRYLKNSMHLSHD